MYLVLRAGVSFVLTPRLCPGRVRDHCLPPSNVAGGTYIALPANTALMEDGTLEAVLAVLELLAMDVLNEYLELPIIDVAEDSMEDSAEEWIEDTVPNTGHETHGVESDASMASDSDDPESCRSVMHQFDVVKDGLAPPAG